MNLSKNVKITKIKAGAASATTEVVSDAVDMQGYEGVVFFTTIATANAGNYLKAQQAAVSAMTNAVDLAQKKIVAAADASVVWLDIYKPTKRYLTANIVRGAATITGDIYAIQYSGNKFPESNLEANKLIGELLISPEEKAI
ncbi:MAG: hypothetical protein K0R80_151 [Clostridia bacterium]|jgi:hypothetical protein|nr:hypothetical protein [Clostridia bacterium]